MTTLTSKPLTFKLNLEQTESGDAKSNTAKPLINVLQNEVIPHLHNLSSSEANEGGAANRIEELTPGESPHHVPTAAGLVDLVIHHQTTEATQQLITLRDEGVPFSSICLDLLAPAARLLGEAWKCDFEDFRTVTIAVGNLQQLMREIQILRPEPLWLRGQHHSILLAPTPGEQHTFGLSMLGDFFRHAGWHVCGGPGMSSDEICNYLSLNPVDVLGLSLGNPRLLENTASTIRAARVRSSNKDISVLIGGNVFDEQPELVALTGADKYANDPHQAVVFAQTLVDASLAKFV